MFKLMSISKKFEDTYNINAFLYALAKVPFLNKLIDSDIYKYTNDKEVFHILITIFDMVKDFSIKLIYFLLF